MKAVLGIAAGGAIAALARFGLASLLEPLPGIVPWTTLTANAAGCLLIGLLTGLTSKLAWPGWLMEAAKTGFLGGFTTFSAFGIETIGLLTEGRLLLAAAYAAGSVVVGYGLAVLGLRFGRRHAAHGQRL